MRNILKIRMALVCHRCEKKQLLCRLSTVRHSFSLKMSTNTVGVKS